MLRRLRGKGRDGAYQPPPPISIQPIGRVANRFATPRTRDWTSVRSRIVLRPDLAPALDGLAGHSHLLVIFWMHEVPEHARTRVTHHLHGDEDLPRKGDLATRSQNRPNPIGVSACRIEGFADNVIRVVGLDAIDGTPVLDIKPYLGEYDAFDDAQAPPWVYGQFDG
ncbi:MAG: tRNA (N6-threonylcarbamoyladenosine(37)-N6)-methyltransferase TrmO [Dehalococcoidia bacterium]|nr:tRNA (N6-threonylcarbamoyladenosine(37)-N6)-methyltransferase TrmO [Dehalococcoidia bacterium]